VRILRRLVPELGYLAVARLAWGHRGTVVRAGDLLLELPSVVQEKGVTGVVDAGRELVRLDRTRPTDMTFRPSRARTTATTPAR
jgi:hypothetical protein